MKTLARAGLALSLAAVLVACDGSGGDPQTGSDVAAEDTTAPHLDGSGTADGTTPVPDAKNDARGDAAGTPDVPSPIDTPTADAPTADAPATPDTGLPPQTCDDGHKNDGETDVDCGGPCRACATGKVCGDHDDCLSATCIYGLCRDPECDDGVQNQGETDQDCGGPCAPCRDGDTCGDSDDCTSGRCTDGSCTSCADGARNGGETDTDCGGPCGDCADGRGCLTGEDCVNRRCTDGVCTSCDDDARNGGETDVDCGGPCGGCADGDACVANGDCASNRCAGGTCSSCNDEQRNGGESDVDCGGPCPRCGDGDDCGVDGDCASSRCTDGVCTSCDDDVRNGGETGVDCGGPCAGCGDGAPCTVDGDCSGARVCRGGACCTPNACGVCGALPAETCDGQDNDCDGQTDEAAGIGTAPLCDEQRGVCAGARSACRGADGWVCDAAVYDAHDGEYEAGAETTCDAKDNDCDGQTDEGLTNACGACGPLPAEICNYRDDDCDGATDEDDVCDICNLPHDPFVLDTSGPGESLKSTTQDWVARLGDQVYVVVTPNDVYEKLRIHVIEDAALQVTRPTGDSYHDAASLVAGGGALHLGQPYFDTLVEAARYRQLDDRAIGQELYTVRPSDRATVTWGAGAAWMVHQPGFQEPHVLSKRVAENVWEEVGPLGVDLPESWPLDVAVASDETTWLAWREGAFRGFTYVAPLGGPRELVCPVWADCQYPVLRFGPDDRLHLLVGVAFYAPLPTGSGPHNVYYYARSGDGWAAPVDIDWGFGANLAFGPDGTLYVSYLRDPTHLWLARSTDGTTWTREPVYNLTEPREFGKTTALVVDDRGRAHIAVQTAVNPNSVASVRESRVHFALHCPTTTPPACLPECGGLECGDDGCGGTCGSCGEGTDCVEGECLAPGSCGYDPVYTCRGRCGVQGGACDCHSWCTSNCCPDRVVCCQ